MTSSARSFEGCTSVSADYLRKIPSKFPPRSTILGRLFSLSVVHTPEGKTVPRLSCVLRDVDFPVSNGGSGYEPPLKGPTGPVERYVVRVDILPGPSFSRAGGKMALRSVHTQLAGYLIKQGMAKKVRLSVGDAVFKGFELVEDKRHMVIECAGNRMIGFEDQLATILVLAETFKPSWLPSQSLPPSPPIQIHQDTSTASAPVLEPTPNVIPSTAVNLPTQSNLSAPSTSRLRPVSSHLSQIGPIPPVISQRPDPKGKRRSSDENYPSNTQAKKQRVEDQSKPDPVQGGLEGVANMSTAGRGPAGPKVVARVQDSMVISDEIPKDPHSTTDSISKYTTAPPTLPPHLTSSDIENPRSDRIPSSTGPDAQATNQPAQAAPKPTILSNSLNPAGSMVTVPAGNAERAASTAAAAARRRAAQEAAAQTEFAPRAITASKSVPADQTNILQPGYSHTHPTPNATISNSSTSSALSDIQQRRQAEDEAIRQAKARQAQARITQSQRYEAIGRISEASGGNPVPGQAVPDRGPHPDRPSILGSDSHSRSVSGDGSRSISRSGPAARQVCTEIKNMQAIIDACGKNARGTVIGVVLQSQPAYEKSSWIRTYLIADPSVPGDEEKLALTIFRDTSEELPELLRGTPILYRGMKLTVQNDKPKGTGFRDKVRSFAYLKSDQVILTGPGEQQVLDEERLKLLEIRDWWKSIDEDSSSGAEKNLEYMAPQVNVKLKLLKEITKDTFCDLKVKVIQVYDQHNHPAMGQDNLPVMEVYVADGTLCSVDVYNYHRVDGGLPPGAVIRLVIFTQQTPQDRRQLFQVGKYLRIPNVRVESSEEGLRFVWSDLMTSDQVNKRFRDKLVTAAWDNEALVIEQRIQALLGNRAPVDDISNIHTVSASVEPILARAQIPSPTITASAIIASTPVLRPIQPIPLSTKLSTVHQDEYLHPLTPLADIDTNLLLPNRFKVQARVARISSAGKKGGSWITKFCKKCNRSFDTTNCGSCQDTLLANAELRYRFVMHLSSSTAHPLEESSLTNTSENLTVLVADQDAADFLPPLQPLDASFNSDPKKQISLTKRIASTQNEIRTLLMGNTMDDKRTCPMVEWSLESYVARSKGKGKAPLEAVTMYRVFGMKAM